MRKWEWIVWHTAADRRDGGRYDTSAAEIEAWHKARGWKEIGYHFVVRRSGVIEIGRDLLKVGAHTLGLNTKAIGICFSGHGDMAPLTEMQYHAGLELSAKLIRQFAIKGQPGYEIPVIGHREVNYLVTRQLLDKRYKTTKTCPGQHVSMVKTRALIKQILDGKPL